MGIILFAMVCGTLPFDDEELPKLYKKIGSGQFDVPEFASADVIDLFKRILVVDPDKRITLPEIMTHPWLVKTITEPFVRDASLDV